MKKSISILLIVTFVISMLIPPGLEVQSAAASSSHNNMFNSTVTDAVYTDVTLNPSIDPDDLITISTVSERFQVKRDWIIFELGKGYALNDIYQALLAQEQGGSYESSIQEKYPSVTAMSFAESTELLDIEAGSLSRADEPSVTDVTYDELSQQASVTDQVYPSSDMSTLAANGFDEIALQRQSIKFDQAPYGVGSVNDAISTVDGSLQLNVTDLVMPGAGGLDFELRRKYDSSLGRDRIYAITSPNVLNATKENAEEKRFPLGKGWIWDLPYVKHEEGVAYIYIPDVGTFAGNNTEISGLSGYPWKNLTFGPVQSNLELAGGKAYYILKNANSGIVHYFSQSGNLLQIRNQYGNSIDFYYTAITGYGTVLNYILNRDGDIVQMMSFTYGSNEVKVTFKDQVITYKKRDVESNGRTQSVLNEVIDPEGRSTKYGYLRWNSLPFNLVDYYKDYTGENQLIYWGHNDWIQLTSIEHPTKAMTQYTFSGTISRKLGPAGVETQPRYETRRVFYSNVSEEVTNDLSLTFSGDVGAVYGQNSTFSTVVDDGLTRTEYIYKKQYVAFNKPDVMYNTQLKSESHQGGSGRVTTYSYNEATYRAVPTRIEEYSFDAGGSSSPAITTLQYNEWGQITSRTDPLGAKTTSAYEMKSFSGFNLSPLVVLTKKNETGGSNQELSTQYVYNSINGALTQVVVQDNQGKLLEQVNYQHDQFGYPIVVQIKGETTDTIIHQQFGFTSMRPIRQEVNVSDVSGNSSTITLQAGFNPKGEMESYTDGNQNKTITTYDKLGRVTSEKNPDGTTTTLSYDDINNSLTVTTPDLSKTVYRFDPLGRLSSETNERGSIAYSYDAYDRLVAQTDAAGQTKMYSYDAFDRVIREQDGTSTTQMTYDDTARTRTVTDGENNRIRETYNVVGQVTKTEELRAAGNVVLASYSYDTKGNLISVTDGNGNLTTNGYDALSRLTSVTDAENKKTSYTYSLDGDVTKVSYADGKTLQKRYDEIGRVLVETDPLGQSTQYTYDANSNLTKILDRKGQEQTYVYNNRNFLVENQATDGLITYSYDAMGRRTSMLDSTGSNKYTYTPTGELERITYPDGATLTFAYDARGIRTGQTFKQGSYTLTLGASFKGASALLASQSLTSNSGAVLGSLTYTYRGNNSLAQKSAASGWKETYTYEGLNLTGLAHTFNGAKGPSYSYVYDNNRNITSKTDQGVKAQFTYDKLNRIKTSSQYAETYTYDARDNRSSLESSKDWSPPAAVSYTYNGRNQLTAATVQDQSVSYRYNGDGLMTERSTGGQKTRYYYDDRGLLVAEGTVSSAATVQITVGYVHDASGYPIARQLSGQSQLQYYVTNGHGDVTEIRDASGNILNEYTYDIWGNPEKTKEKVPNVLRYAGEYFDETTGLQYLRARWYDPSVGRFITEDTFDGDYTNPLSLNLYTYVENNPLKYVDFTGESKRPTKNTMEGLGQGSGSASAGRSSSSGNMGGGGRGGNSSGKGSTSSKPSTSNNGQSSKGTTGTGNSFTSTQNAANSVGKKFDGTVSELKNGWKVEIKNGNKPIVVRIMNAGSGGRSKPYFRVSVDGKGSFTLDGKLSHDKALTHIDMNDNFLKQITDIVKSYMK